MSSSNMTKMERLDAMMKIETSAGVIAALESHDREISWFEYHSPESPFLVILKNKRVELLKHLEEVQIEISDRLEIVSTIEFTYGEDGWDSYTNVLILE